MRSKTTTVAEYLASVPPDRRFVLEALRGAIRANLDGYEEGMQYGMIGYFVPLTSFPAGYHCDPTQPLPFAGLAAQKQHVALYLMGVHGDPEETAWFRAAWAKSGRKLDMGKACVRFRDLDDVALNVVAEAIRRMPAARYIEQYTSNLAASRGDANAKSGASGKRATAAAAKATKAAKPTKSAPTRPARGPGPTRAATATGAATGKAKGNAQGKGKAKAKGKGKAEEQGRRAPSARTSAPTALRTTTSGGRSGKTGSTASRARAAAKRR